MDADTTTWLLEGDPAVRWQVLRDLQGAPNDESAAERARVAKEGWGAQLLALQRPSGSWGDGSYGPKWTSTFYTLLLLTVLGLPGENEQGRNAAERPYDRGKRPDGGLDYGSARTSETCVTGMGLQMLAHFGLPAKDLAPIADHLLEAQMPDGGWNCQRPRGATHASFHTTISALEGLHAFGVKVPEYENRVRDASERGREFLLNHRLFRSHTTGVVVSDALTRFHFPAHWHYDILRALDYFVAAGAPRDERLAEALEIVERRRTADGRWKLPARYPGRYHFGMEPAGKASRVNTLRAVRALRWWSEGAAN